MAKKFALIHFPYFQLDPDKGRGVEHFIKKNLELEGNQVIVIRPDLPFYDIFFKILRVLKKLQGINYHFYRKKVILNALSKSVNKQLKGLDYDYIIAFGTLPLYNIKSDKPKLMWSDTTFRNILNYYNDYKSLDKSQISEFEEIEQQVFNEASYLFLTSSWAVNSAVNDYKISPSKVFEIPFGANLLNEVILDETSTKQENDKTLKLLFIGKNWERKGGEIVFELCTKLKEKNIDFHLNIIGSEPEIKPDLKNKVTSFGLLDKSKEDENKLFNQLLLESHFFIMPSKAEAFGHVYCEANAYGLPAIATKTGGIPSVILDNINGFTFEIDSFVKDCTEYLENINVKSQEYLELCKNSRKRYEEYLNWRSSIKKILEIVK